MSSEKSESKTDVIVKLVLVFFVCLLSFSIGTFVGKKFSDNQYKLAQFEPSGQNNHSSGHEKTEEQEPSETAAASSEHEEARDVASVPASLPTPTPKKEGHEDLIKLAESFQKEGVVASQPRPSVQEKSAKEIEPAEQTPEVKLGEAPDPSQRALGKLEVKPLDPAQRIANNLPPEPELVEPPQDSRIPSSLPRELASSPIGKYTVQVGSFPTEAEAQKKAADLKAKGFASFYIKAKVKDASAKAEKIWFRVSVGLFATSKEAEAKRKDVLQQAQISSAIVQRIAN